MNWKGKSVLVTGADGFIGSHLTELLLSKGAKVRALNLYNSFNNWGWLEDIENYENNDSLEIVNGDIRDAHFCQELCKNIDVVFHLAALIAIPYSYVAPTSYIRTNVEGTVNMLQAAKTNGCSKFLHTSTSEVYGTAQYVPIDEKHPLQPQSPYSASKIGADNMALSFYNAFELPVIVVRPFNTYGPRQSARAVIPTIITQIANGMKEIKLGDLSPTRDFNYVKDTALGFVKIAETNGVEGEVINIASNYEISIQDTLYKIKEMMDSDVKFIIDKNRIRPGKSEVFRLFGDNSKLKELTGFVPQYGLDKGLMETIEWFSISENLKKYKAHIYNV